MFMCHCVCVCVRERMCAWVWVLTCGCVSLAVAAFSARVSLAVTLPAYYVSLLTQRRRRSLHFSNARPWTSLCCLHRLSNTHTLHKYYISADLWTPPCSPAVITHLWPLTLHGSSLVFLCVHVALLILCSLSWKVMIDCLKGVILLFVFPEGHLYKG